MKININTNNTNTTFGLIELNSSDKQKSESLLKSIINHAKVEKEKIIFQLSYIIYWNHILLKKGFSGQEIVTRWKTLCQI